MGTDRFPSSYESTPTSNLLARASTAASCTAASQCSYSMSRGCFAVAAQNFASLFGVGPSWLPIYTSSAYCASRMSWHGLALPRRGLHSFYAPIACWALLLYCGYTLGPIAEKGAHGRPFRLPTASEGHNIDLLHALAFHSRVVRPTISAPQWLAEVLLRCRSGQLRYHHKVVLSWLLFSTSRILFATLPLWPLATASCSLPTQPQLARLLQRNRDL